MVMLHRPTFMAQRSVVRRDLPPLPGSLQPQASDRVPMMLNALATHDPWTYLHSMRVGHVVRWLAAELGCRPQEVEQAQLAGVLHDIGKINCPRSLLQQHAPLTLDNVELLMLHPVEGAQMVQAAPELAALAPLIAAHHERLDGRGFPARLLAAEIPWIAQVIAVADAVDGLFYGRPTVQPLLPGAISAVLRAGAGTRWDPWIANCAADRLIPQMATADAIPS